ncbi:ArsR/SmtB family transcription factor [Streptomyces rapamycinicus]|uniref:ArsR/SmtB family transcription factor n=1 Tax=Streptomyces rapamycinicus TaxID=1226757 RepID=UPI002073ED0B|nr:helix-turn-helix domain-containing protein [Streptomyces rapamycinicus]
MLVVLGHQVAGNAGGTDVAASVLTRHFRVLREAGLIRQHDVGTRRINTLCKEELDRRFPGLLALVLRERVGRVEPYENVESC